MSVVFTMTSLAVAMTISAAAGSISVVGLLKTQCDNKMETGEAVRTRFRDKEILKKTLEEHGFPVTEYADGSMEIKTSVGNLRYYKTEGEPAYWMQAFDLKSEEELEMQEAEIMEEYMLNVQKSTYLLLKERLKKSQDMELEKEMVLEDGSIMLTVNV